MFDIEFALRNISYHKAHITGSSFICDPPVLNTDIDVVVWATAATHEDLILDGWAKGEDYGGWSVSYRKGRYKIIYVDTQHKFYRWVGATYVAKLLNLQEKQDRIDMFEALINYAPLAKKEY